MLSHIVMPGQKVEIQRIHQASSGEKDAERKVYRTKVFDIPDEDRLELMMPMEKGKLILLPTGARFELCFFTEKGLYQCYARVADRYKSNNIYILVMEPVSSLQKHQRREYYRFPCALRIEFRLLEEEEVKAVEEKRAYLVPGLPLNRGVIVDISGGGLRFISSYRYEEGSLIYCRYYLTLQDKTKECHMVGRVLAMKELENKPNVFEHRVQYVNMDTSIREDIIKFIFQEERKKQHNDKRGGSKG